MARLGRRESGIGGPGNKLWERFRWESLGRLEIKGGACKILLRGGKGWEKAELCSGQLVRSPFGNEIGSWEKVKHH